MQPIRFMLNGQAHALSVAAPSRPPTAGAIANALFDALGVRVRDLTFTPERIVAAMDKQ